MNNKMEESKEKNLVLKLKFSERIMMESIMPGKGSYENLLIRRDLLDKIKITQEDLKVNHYSEGEKGASWSEVSETLDVSITELEKVYLKTKLKEASESGNLSEHLTNVYGIIV